MMDGVNQMIISHDLMCNIIRQHLQGQKPYSPTWTVPIVVTISQSKRDKSFTVNFDTGMKVKKA